MNFIFPGTPKKIFVGGVEMEELKKELETLLGFEDEVDDVALYDCSSLEERFEDVVVCLYDLIDSMDKNKFRCSELEEKE